MLNAGAAKLQWLGSGSFQVEAVPACSPCSAASTPTSLWLLWLWRRGHFLPEVAQEKFEGPQRLLTMQNQRGSRALVQDVRKPPHDERGHSGRQGSRVVLERNLTQAWWACRPWLCPHSPQLWDPGEPLQGEEVKLIRKVGDT
ncbi:hypothetical protein QTO34_010837 [Cnephaeus nilssonii]|uniref:Uncharacterized protein n=1 Tax=Cnephaeus nilssonii TaxID=3371016 RepID=A0AA40HG62_CNENI|nr:hypothetical protein QTO34_010837 [Eptesicus nilssonii]